MPERREASPSRAATASTLAVDAGQTATRASLADGALTGPVGYGPGVRHLHAPGGVEHAAAAIASAAQGAGVEHAAVTDTQGAGVEHAAVAASQSARPPHGGIELVCVGLSGFAAGAPALERLSGALAVRLGAARVVVASDVVTAYLGAHGQRAGVVVAAGTGSVTLAADGCGAIALVDGWGHLLGDAGSAFAIGRAGLASALCAHDGRGGSDALRARAAAAFGPLDELPAAIYGSEDPVRRVAGFARAVADAARAGDDAARALWTAAASELASAVVAAAERALGVGVPADVSWSGGPFAAEDLLLAPFSRRLAQQAPHLRVVAPAATPLDGARLLGETDVRALFPGLVWEWEPA